jgi:hypothetical protein
VYKKSGRGRDAPYPVAKSGGGLAEAAHRGITGNEEAKKTFYTGEFRPATMHRIPKWDAVTRRRAPSDRRDAGAEGLVLLLRAGRGDDVVDRHDVGVLPAADADGREAIIHRMVLGRLALVHQAAHFVLLRLWETAIRGRDLYLSTPPPLCQVILYAEIIVKKISIY